jgi:DinB superfamily
MSALVQHTTARQRSGRAHSPSICFRYAGTAAESLAQLDGVYAQWIAGVRALDTAGLSRPCGPSEVQYGNPADLPLVSLVLHISREVIHHGAEIALLRDLYTPGHPMAR